MPTQTDIRRPAPPDDLDGEALLEWQRVCDDLAAAGRLDKTDRAALTLYVETWAVNRKAAAHVHAFGPVIKYPNEIMGENPSMKVMRAATKQLQAMLNDFGLTPAARGKNSTEPDDELKF